MYTLQQRREIRPACKYSISEWDKIIHGIRASSKSKYCYFKTCAGSVYRSARSTLPVRTENQIRLYGAYPRYLFLTYSVGFSCLWIRSIGIWVLSTVSNDNGRIVLVYIRLYHSYTTRSRDFQKFEFLIVLRTRVISLGVRYRNLSFKNIL